MRWGAMAALLSALLAAPAPAERNPAVRVYVQAAGAGVHGVADSVEDVKLLRRRADWPAIGIEFEEPKTTLALGVVQGGANRSVSLAVPE